MYGEFACWAWSPARWLIASAGLPVSRSRSPWRASVVRLSWRSVTGCVPPGHQTGGSQPGAASSKPSKSNAGATMQPTSAHAPSGRAACHAPAGTTTCGLVARDDVRPEPMRPRPPARPPTRRADLERLAGRELPDLVGVDPMPVRPLAGREEVEDRAARRPGAVDRPAPATSRRTSRPRDGHAVAGRRSRPRHRACLEGIAAGARPGPGRRTVRACAEASRPSVVPRPQPRPVNWRPPPASSSARSAAIASPRPAIARRSKPPSRRSRRRRSICSITWASPSRKARTAGRRRPRRR